MNKHQIAVLGSTVLLLQACHLMLPYEKASTDAGLGSDAGDASVSDAFADAEEQLPDSARPDIFLVPDAGCPEGTTQCGEACSDLLSDWWNCGECFNTCLEKIADRCEKGKCMCGAAEPCGDSLNCVEEECLCISGGRCKGCCFENECKDGTSLTECGAQGAKCKSCVDELDCTTDACGSEGSCSHVLEPEFCLISHVCYSEGTPEVTGIPCMACISEVGAGDWSPVPDPGCVTTEAGSGVVGIANGPASVAQFKYPSAVALGPSGKIYVADTKNHRIRVIDNGVVSNFAGNGVAGYADGAAALAQFNHPTGIAVASGGKVFVADSMNHRIRVILMGSTGQWSVETVAGSGMAGFKDSTALDAMFNQPAGIAMTTGSVIYVADTMNHSIRMIAGGNVSTLAGTGQPGALDEVAIESSFNEPRDVAVCEEGVDSNWIVVADTGNHRIRVISPDPTLSKYLVYTEAGSYKGYLEAAGMTAQFDTPSGVALDAACMIYVADTGNQRIRVVTDTMTSTLAGSGMAGHQDGAAEVARFYTPMGLAVDIEGNVHIADHDNQRIRLYTK